MHSSASRVKLPSIEEIEKIKGEFNDEAEDGQAIDTESMIREAKAECEKIIAQAHENAVSIEERAKKEAEMLKEAQSNLGYIEGKNKGEKEMAAVLEEHKAEFAREIDALKNYREQMFEAVKGNVVECLKLLCKKIIFHEYEDDNTIINNMIDHYYYMIKDRSNLVLKVSREDYAKLDMAQLESRGIEVKVDETFTHGDLVISCDAEGIDFGLSGQLEKAESSIGVQ